MALRPVHVRNCLNRHTYILYHIFIIPSSAFFLTLYNLFIILYSVMKTKGQQPRSLNWNCWPFVSIARVAQMEERLAANEEVAGSTPATGTTFSPDCSANCLRGLTSGLRQRQGFYAHCHF